MSGMSRFYTVSSVIRLASNWIIPISIGGPATSVSRGWVGGSKSRVGVGGEGGGGRGGRRGGKSRGKRYKGLTETESESKPDGEWVGVRRDHGWVSEMTVEVGVWGS